MSEQQHKWSKKAPNAPGFWWHKHEENARPRGIKVTYVYESYNPSNRKTLVYDTVYYDDLPVKDRGGYWCKAVDPPDMKSVESV